MTEMTMKIRQELDALEQEEGIRILYACESGSRAWGFPSKDSDYDVRFIYVRPVDWYLSIFDKRDVIERPISEMLDISGWDLRKGLNLFRKSNPPLMEWLDSPIVYAEACHTAERLRQLSSQAYSPKASIYHYLHMARGNYRTYLQGEVVRIKKYFYVLRPILACEWILRKGTMPPIAFESLIEALLPKDGELSRQIEELLIRKKSGDEWDDQPRISVLNAYIEEQLASLEQAAAQLPGAKSGIDSELDELFRDLLREAWN
ncbi:nucleotidyltransferase domain-containing protein [Paenibacillus paeoniae]|uniref:Nucleotidyltransferase domain-containing protein n=1 Tax=Paenibacillus paeoniae TaxID=2292705 RepID=A0A371PEE9_9BACL|nr:nucleotidyltransferase domain-containing protein [Paenibacillus paeoniae]REK74295.1 nucleotidyltransferase domain-containing protein [Paenibacillus paeoniae]